MERVCIIGSNGAGKSTFSYALAEKTGLPLVHLDRLYWRSGWQVTPREEFQAALRAEAARPRWIIEGNNLSTLESRLAGADTVFWFEFSPILCMLGILRREWRYRGTDGRPDMASGCPGKVDLSFLRVAWGFNRKNHGKITEMLEKFPHLTVVRFTRRSQVRRYLSALE